MSVRMKQRYASSGVQTNGLSLCRRLATQLPKGYETPIGRGDPRTFGDALLAPSVIYVAFVRECQRQGLKLNYVAHVTGHGWRKLLRHPGTFTYRITAVPKVPPVLSFIQHHAGQDDAEREAAWAEYYQENPEAAPAGEGPQTAE